MHLLNGIKKNIRAGMLSVCLLALLASCAPVVEVLTPTVMVPSNPTPSITVTPTVEPPSSEDSLIKFIISDLASSEPAHRFIGQVTAADSIAPLPIDAASLQQCWNLQNGALSDCLPVEFMTAYQAEKVTGWTNSYVVFAVIETNWESTTANVRLDELAGPNSARGALYTLSRVSGTWQVDSRKLLWTR